VPAAPTAARPSRHWLLGLAVWQVVVWGTRIDNVLGDDGLTSTDKLLRLALSASFFAFGVVAVWVWRQLGPRGRLGQATMPSGTRWIRVGAAWTVVVWVVRGADIALSGHSGAFVAIHLVLAAVSIALAGQAVRVVGTGRVRPAISPTATSNT
jgi:hypothetical protein